jgi:hypothetical protein
MYAKYSPNPESLRALFWRHDQEARAHRPVARCAGVDAARGAFCLDIFGLREWPEQYVRVTRIAAALDERLVSGSVNFPALTHK